MTAEALPNNSWRGNQKEIFGILTAVLVAGIVLLLPTPAGLPPAGQRMAAIFLAVLVLLVTEAIPVAVTSLLMLIFQPIFGVAPLPEAFTNFINPAFFFVLVMFVIAFAFGSTGLAKRFAYWLIAKAGTESKRVVWVFVIGTGLLSTIISDIPCCAIFMTIALDLFAKLKITPGQSSFAKSLMIGIPMGALIGGVGTPAGSSVNVLGLFLIQQHGKVSVPFLLWMAIGIPMVIILLPLTAWVLTRVFPPEFSSIGELSDIKAEQAQLGKISVSEKKVLSVMAGMLALWIAGTWIRSLDTVLVGIGGAALFFLPGMKLFSWKQAERATGWEILLMGGGISSIGAASAKTGLAKWIVDAALGGLHDWNVVWIIALISLFTVVIHLVLPVSPVINVVLVPPVALLAIASGHHPALYCLPVVFTASCRICNKATAVYLS